MKLTKAAILAIRGLNQEQKQQLVDHLGISLKTLYRYIENNDDNLTKASALQFLRGVTGLKDADLLEGSGMVTEAKEVQS